MDVGKLFGSLLLAAQSWTSGIDAAIQGVDRLASAAVAAGATIAAGLGAATGIGVSVASSAQQAQVALEVMTGSATVAGDLLSDLRSMAAKTPFETQDLVQGAQSLMAMGFAAEDTIPVLWALGDAAASSPKGMQAALPLIVRAFGQIKTKGKVSMEELNQLAENGVGAIDMLAKSMGITAAEAMDRVSSGAVDAGTGLAALMEGIQAKMGGMMERQAQTLDGVLSTLSDTVKNALGDAAVPLVEALTDAVPAVSALAGSMVSGLDPFIAAMASAARWAGGLVQQFNAVDASARTMGASGVASVGLVVGAIGALVYAANAATAAVGALSAAVAGLEAIAAPLLAIAGVVGVVGAAFYALYRVMATEGEGPLAFLGRMAAVLWESLLPAIEAAQVAGAAFVAGLSAGFGDIMPAVQLVGASLRDAIVSALELIDALMGAGGGWQTWYQLGAILGQIAHVLAVVVAGGLKTTILLVRALASVFGPLIVAVSTFEKGLLSLVTGSKSVGDAVKQMGNGIGGIFASVFTGIVNTVLGAISVISASIATMLSALPGGGAAGAAMMEVADWTAGAAQSIANGLNAMVVAPRRFNMETEGAADSASGFNMEVDAAAQASSSFRFDLDAASGGMARYGSALDHLIGQTDAASKAAKGAAKAAAAPVDISALAEQFATQYDARSNPAAEFLRRFYKDVEQAASASDLIGLRADLAAAMTAYGLTMEQVIAAEEAIASKVLASVRSAGMAIGEAAAQGAADMAASMRARLQSVAESVGGVFAEAAGNLGQTIQAAVQGASTGGAAGAAVAAIGSMLSQNAAFQNLIASLNTQFSAIVTALNPLVQAIGMVLVPVMQLVGVLMGALAPSFRLIGQILQMLAPALAMIGGVLQAVGLIISVAVSILEPVMPLLELSFRILFNVLKAVALIVMGVAWLIGSAWNLVLEGVAKIVSALSNALGGIEALDDLAKRIRDQKVDTEGMAESMAELAATTYDQAYASALAGAQTAMLGDAAAEAAASLMNVPAGYKVALTRFQQMSPESAGNAAMQRSGNGSGATTYIGNLTITAVDPSQIIAEIDRRTAQQAWRQTGVSLAQQTPRWAGNGGGGGA